MRAFVVHTYINKKIEKLILDDKNIDEVIDALYKRIGIKTDKNIQIREYMDKFSSKRIGDIQFIRSKNNFKNLTPKKILNLIKLRDKIIGQSDFDI